MTVSPKSCSRWRGSHGLRLLTPASMGSWNCQTTCVRPSTRGSSATSMWPSVAGSTLRKRSISSISPLMGRLSSRKPRLCQARKYSLGRNCCVCIGSKLTSLHGRSGWSGWHDHGMLVLWIRANPCVHFSGQYVNEKNQVYWAYPCEETGRFSRKAHTGKVAIGTRLVHLFHDPTPL